MLKVLGIAQQRVDISHNGDDRLGLSRTLVAILDGEKRVYHLMDMTSILRQIELLTCVVIVFSHCLMMLTSKDSLMVNVAYEP